MKLRVVHFHSSSPSAALTFAFPTMCNSKTRGLGAGRKLRTLRRENRWHDKDYCRANLGSEWKKPFAGCSHSKGIVLEKMCAFPASASFRRRPSLRVGRLQRPRLAACPRSVRIRASAEGVRLRPSPLAAALRPSSRTPLFASACVCSSSRTARRLPASCRTTVASTSSTRT